MTQDHTDRQIQLALQIVNAANPVVCNVDLNDVTQAYLFAGISNFLSIARHIAPHVTTEQFNLAGTELANAFGELLIAKAASLGVPVGRVDVNGQEQIIGSGN